MDIIRDIIFDENLELLKKISDDIFDLDKDNENFIKKYNKSSYRWMNVKMEDNINFYKKMIKRVKK
jgi:hypothetical protein